MSCDVFLCNELLFGDLDKAAPHLQDIMFQNLHSWGMNRHFQAKLTKYQQLYNRNYCIDSTEILYSDKDNDKSKMADGHHRKI